MDDQVLLRFSPKNSESTYYFSDMVGAVLIDISDTLYDLIFFFFLVLLILIQIGGTLTFFHEEGARRCLEVISYDNCCEIIIRN